MGCTTATRERSDPFASSCLAAEDILESGKVAGGQNDDKVASCARMTTGSIEGEGPACAAGMIQYVR